MELPARTLSKPQQAVPLWPLSPSGAIRQPARDFQQGASFSSTNAATPATDKSCRTALPPAAIQAAVSLR
ncbi:hypothetical protein CN116_28350 [Sinorhizobium meliloti]|nr:hypothetical protein CDO22_20265 [Sinorhizobium meliloti]RVE77189.1 hypothetical protein CN240_31335 [Sinorhizobium meliloti]RVG41361.1 hypothetical protein CN227_28965 [Sinorhizobium meliloti]RVI61722.1 hypothetical protein CN187_29255 [Sinorhizobium meliloti]RVI78742.1 hypothetical protein CN191_14765 [Sinorhizobium meliloti]